MVLGNGSYKGVVVPTDLLAAEGAISVGLLPTQIIVARQLSPSSQQRELLDAVTLPLIRESMIVLKKA